MPLLPGPPRQTMKNFWIYAFVFGIAVFFVGVFFVGSLPKMSNSTLRLGIKTCKNQKNTADCLSSFFRSYLRVKNTKSVLQEINMLQSKDSNIRLICHDAVHSIGRETFGKTGTISDSFNECDQTCHSGCYHGAVERFLRGEGSTKYGNENVNHIAENEIKSKITVTCPESQPLNIRLQCLHGLGHAIVYFLNYDLFKSLSWCDFLKKEIDQGVCRRGAFMENVTGVEKSKRFLSNRDPHFPCSVVEDNLKSDCYSIQTTRMLEMGLSEGQIIDECKKAREWRSICMESFGRDKSIYVSIDGPINVAKICAKLITQSDKNACIRGVSYALVGNTSDGKYVFPFCQSFEKDEDKKYCYNLSIIPLNTLAALNKDGILSSCKKYVPLSKICLDTVKIIPEVTLVVESETKD